MRILVQSLVLALSTLGTFAHAQDFPTKPITIVNPLTAGTGVDVMTRLYADAVARDTGQRILVENKTGSGGIAAALAVKDARPDGYTLLVAHVGTQSTLPAMQTLPFDALKDFEPITELFYFPTYLVVPAASPAKTAADLIALAKTKPGGVRLASQGVGSGTISSARSGRTWLKRQSSTCPIAATAVLPDLLAGRVDMSFISYLTIRELVKDGNLRILAVASFRYRVPQASADGRSRQRADRTGTEILHRGQGPQEAREAHRHASEGTGGAEETRRRVESEDARTKATTFKPSHLTADLFLYVKPTDGKRPTMVTPNVIQPSVDFFVKPLPPTPPTPPTPPVPPKPPAPPAPQVDKFEKLVGELIAAKKSDEAILEAITLATLDYPTDSEKKLAPLVAISTAPSTARPRGSAW